MKTPTGLSPSSITTWEQCQYKYMRLYDGGEEGKLPRAHSATAVEGSLVHDVLELWHKDRSLDWRDLLKDIAVKKKSEFTGEHQYQAVLARQYSGAWQLLGEYMKRSDIHPKVLDTEISFDFVLPNGVPVRGRIDRVDDLGNGHIALVDYKTTRTYIWKSEVEESIQGMIYALVASHFLFPKAKKYSFTIDALRFNPITVEYTKDQLEAALDYIEVVYDTIIATDASDCKPRLNKFCGYCQLQDVCPAFKAMREAGVGEVIRDFEGNTFREPEEYAADYLLFHEIETCGRKGKSNTESVLDGILEAKASRDETFGNYRVFYENTRFGNPKLKVEQLQKRAEEKNEDTCNEQGD